MFELSQPVHYNTPDGIFKTLVEFKKRASIEDIDVLKVRGNGYVLIRV